MKSVLISIQPKWCELIASGKKTIEVRKTAPKLQTPFKCYIYETKKENDLRAYDVPFIGKDGKVKEGITERKWINRSGKVIGEFVCDRIDTLKYNFDGYGEQWHEWNDEYVDYKDMCLSERELEDYLETSNGYAWHISDLKIYDKPKELGEFFRPVKYNADGPICGTEKEIQDIIEWDCETVFDKESTECTLKDCPRLQELYRITRPPQSWCYVEA